MRGCKVGWGESDRGSNGARLVERLYIVICRSSFWLTKMIKFSNSPLPRDQLNYHKRYDSETFETGQYGCLLVVFAATIDRFIDSSRSLHDPPLPRSPSAALVIGGSYIISCVFTHPTAGQSPPSPPNTHSAPPPSLHAARPLHAAPLAKLAPR